MSTTGLCSVCGDGTADRRCDRCGSLVCDDHFDDGAGYCVECVHELGLDREGDDRSTEDRPDGVDTYRF